MNNSTSTKIGFGCVSIPMIILFLILLINNAPSFFTTIIGVVSVPFFAFFILLFFISNKNKTASNNIRPINKINQNNSEQCCSDFNGSLSTINEFVSLDLETTGFNPNSDYIIEVALVLYQNEKIVDTYSTLINPLIRISEKITSITGIKNSDVKGKPTIDECLNDIVNFIGNRIIVAHNASFDINFLMAAIRNTNLKFKGQSLDTLWFSRNLINDSENHKLPTLIKYFNIDFGQSHRALADATACGNLFIKLINILKNQNEYSELDLQLYKIIYDILNDSKCDLTYYRMLKTKTLTNYSAYHSFLTFKIGVKKSFILISNKYANILDSSLIIDTKTTSKTQTKIILTDINDIYKISDILVNEYNKIVHSLENEHNDYIKNYLLLNYM